VLNAFLINLVLNRIDERVIGSQDFQSFAPWVARLFGHNEAILGLFGLPDTGEANR